MAKPELHAGDCILTYSGHYLNVFDPNPDHICIEDIAHALSHIPRFAGHLEKVICVAEHSVFVAEAVSDSVRLQALLHDASEAYLMDIPKPIKRHLPDYQALENKLMEAIASKFGFSYPLDQEVKEADKNRLEIEHYYLRVKNGVDVTPWTSDQAKSKFLEMYSYILSKLEKEVSNG